jgi:pantetheine-phosphate adenylyltransferase
MTIWQLSAASLPTFRSSVRKKRREKPMEKVKEFRSHKKMKAVYPGSFDPITLGHLDLIQRSCQMFESVIVLVAVNSSKNYLFSTEERIKMIQKSVTHLKNIEIDSFEGLTVNYARKRNAQTLIRGLRAVSDFEKELQMAHTNKSICNEVETIFLATSTEYSFLSSSVVKEIARFGGEVNHLVPSIVATALKEKFQS